MKLAWKLEFVKKMFIFLFRQWDNHTGLEFLLNEKTTHAIMNYESHIIMMQLYREFMLLELPKKQQTNPLYLSYPSEVG